MSFQPIARGLDRQALLKAASALRVAGIGVEVADGDSVLLVRSEHVARARQILADLDDVDESDERG